MQPDRARDLESHRARFVCLLYHDVHPDDEGDYGSLGDSAVRYHVPLAVFRGHLDRIATLALPVLSHGAIVAAAGERLGRRRAVGITFDDGWLSAVQRASAELEARDMPATFFITTGFLGQPWFAGPADLRRLNPDLFAIGSHGVTHRMLSSLDVRSIRAELADSKARLEDIVGRPVTSLSIPGGAVDRRVIEEAREAGYVAIFDSSIRVNPGSRGALGVGRLGIDRLTTPAVFDRWLRFDLHREQLRKTMLTLPKRLLGMRLYSLTRRLLLGEVGRDQHFFRP